MTAPRLSQPQHRALQAVGDGNRAGWQRATWKTRAVLHDLGLVTSDEPGAEITSRGADTVYRVRLEDALERSV